MLTERTFDTGTIKVNYAEGPPNGPPLVTIHGSTARWQDLAPLHDGLVDDWHLFACDARGHGKSSWGESYAVSDFAADLSAFIAGRVGEPVVLIGHSGGAMASLAAAATTPELIRSLVVIDPPLYLHAESVDSNYVGAWFDGVLELLTQQRTTEQFFSALLPDVDAAGRESLMTTLSTLDPEVVRTLAEDRFLDLDLATVIEAISSPTLMLYGEVDKGGVVRARDADFFRTHIANGTATQMTNAGHLIYLDQPELMLELIRDFLAR